MGSMRTWLATGLAAAVFWLAIAAAALDLDAAKQRGLVGEQTDGYVAALETSPSGDVEQLVADVNQRRRASYEAIARKNGTDVKAVAALAAQKLVERAPAGAWIRDGGQWYQKK
jgi:hypothetical protein